MVPQGECPFQLEICFASTGVHPNRVEGCTWLGALYAGVSSWGRCVNVEQPSPREGVAVPREGVAVNNTNSAFLCTASQAAESCDMMRCMCGSAAMCNNRQTEDCTACVCRSFTASFDFCHQQLCSRSFTSSANTTLLGSMDFLL